MRVVCNASVSPDPSPQTSVCVYLGRSIAAERRSKRRGESGCLAEGDYPSPDRRSGFDHNMVRFLDFRTADEIELSVDEEHRKLVEQVLNWLRDGCMALF